jgi:hypothetical protein
MRSILNLVITAVLFVGTAQIAAAQSSTGIATLFARDPLTQSLCLRDGGPGLVFQQGEKRNRCSDLNFDSYTANAFSVGIEGSRKGVILDLGTPQELKGKYGFSETVGGGQGFASIDVGNGRALILKNFRTGELQEIGESAQLFRAPSHGYSSVPVKLGHVYLLRITDPNDKSFEMFAKLLVVAYTPGESVSVRWHLLSNSKTAKVLPGAAHPATR